MGMEFPVESCVLERLAMDVSPSIPLALEATVVVRDLNEITDEPDRLRMSIDTFFPSWKVLKL